MNYDDDDDPADIVEQDRSCIGKTKGEVTDGILSEWDSDTLLKCVARLNPLVRKKAYSELRQLWRGRAIDVYDGKKMDEVLKNMEAALLPDALKEAAEEKHKKESRRQCVGIKMNGERCSRIVYDGTDLCPQHKNQIK